MKTKLSEEAQSAIEQIGKYFAVKKTHKFCDMKYEAESNSFLRYARGLYFFALIGIILGPITIHLVLLEKWNWTFGSIIFLTSIIVLALIPICYTNYILRQPKQRLVRRWKKVSRLILKFGPEPLERTHSAMYVFTLRGYFAQWTIFATQKLADLERRASNEDLIPDEIYLIQEGMRWINIIQAEFNSPNCT